MACPCDSLGLRPKPRAMDGFWGRGHAASGEARCRGRPSKSAAESAEKPSIILARTLGRKPHPFDGERDRRVRTARRATLAVRRNRGRSTLAMTDAASPPPLLVLDTNVVLDWLFFADPACALLSTAIRRRQVRWIASQGDARRDRARAAAVEFAHGALPIGSVLGCVGRRGRRSSPTVDGPLACHACAAPIRTTRSSSISRCEAARLPC